MAMQSWREMGDRCDHISLDTCIKVSRIKKKALCEYQIPEPSKIMSA